MTFLQAVAVFVLVLSAASLSAQSREFDEGIEYAYVGSVEDVKALPDDIVAVRCMSTTDEMLSALEKSIWIEKLDLHASERITDKGVVSLIALKNLRHLNLSACAGLTVESIRSLATLKSISELDVSSMDGVLDFRAVGRFQALTDLRLQWGGLGGIETSVLKHMRTLKYLALGGGQFDIGDEFAGWEKLEGLTTLDLCGSEICDDTLLSLKNTKVRRLNLSLCRGFSNDALADLIAADFLESLSLQLIATIDDSIIAAIGKTTKLRELTLTIDGRVSDKAFESWTEKVSLETIWIRANFSDILKRAKYQGPAQLGPAFSAALGRLRNLRGCTIAGAFALTDEDARKFVKPALRSLVLSRCPLLTSKSLEPLRGSALTKLKLSKFLGVSDEELASLVSTLDSLGELEMFDCGDVGPLLIRAIAARKNGLTVFNLSSAKGLGVEDFRVLGGCGSLRELFISHRDGVNDDALEALNGLKNLRVLQVPKSKITGKGLAAISKLGQLEYLDVSYCDGIVSGDLASFQPPSLHLLSIYHCPNITTRALEDWGKKNLRCKVLR